MKTTVDRPDELLRQVKARAALSGVKLKDLIALYLEQGLRQGEGAPPVEPQRRSPLPLILKAVSGRPIPALSAAQIQAIVDEEDAGQAH